MNTIPHSFDGVPLPDIKACEHIAADMEALDRASRRAAEVLLDGFVKCANCGGLLCPTCEDEAVICHACPGSICKECQETARKRCHPDRPLIWTPHEASSFEYLCNPCRDRQRKAILELCEAFEQFREEEITLRDRCEPFLDEFLEICEPLRTAIEAAKEAL